MKGISGFLEVRYRSRNCFRNGVSGVLVVFGCGRGREYGKEVRRVVCFV